MGLFVLFLIIINLGNRTNSWRLLDLVNYGMLLKSLVGRKGWRMSRSTLSATSAAAKGPRMGASVTPE